MLILSLVKLNIAIFLVLFLPGYFFVRAIFRKNETISKLEKLLLSVAMSITVVDFLMIIIFRLSIRITSLSILISILIFSFICYFLGKRLDKQSRYKAADTDDSDPPKDKNTANSKNTVALFLLLFFFSALLRTVYVANGALPQTTDLGHHMYWSKLITTTGQLPDYGAPDFIIGEHLVFAAIALVSGISFISAMPVAVLLIINLFSILAVFLVVLKVSEIFFYKEFALKASIFSLLVFGIFYAISSPGAKYVSGGVIGNILGNFFIPLALFAFLSTIQSEAHFGKKRKYSFLFLLILITLSYSHHLSSFIFLYVFAGFLALSLIIICYFERFILTRIFSVIKEKALPFLNFKNLTLIFIFFLFLYYVFPLSYLNSSAIDTAVGTPFKDTRIGMGISAIAQSIGPWRFFYGLAGLLILSIIAFVDIFNKKISDSKLKEKLFVFSLISAWFVMIFLMSFDPKLLKVDIPTNRIANYLSLPAAVLSSVGILYLLEKSRNKMRNMHISMTFLILVATGFISGLSDASDSTRDEKNPKEVMQTYRAAEYLSKNTGLDEIILKDHIYLAGDAWMKLFLMRDYKNPLSRSLLRRYDDPAKDRETCTRDMVAEPDSGIGTQCFEDLAVNYVVLKPGYDTTQFDKSKNFSKILAGKDVAIYQRTLNSNGQ